MRLLHPRHGHERDRSGEELPRPQRGTDPRAARRESVPLHRLSHYRQADQTGLADYEELDMTTPYICASIKRKEDYRFLTRAGHYTDDVALPSLTDAHLV